MILELLAIKEINKPPEIPQPKPQATVQVEQKKKTRPKKIYYKVVKGDTLTKVSKRFKRPLGRIVCANPKLSNPDLITPGERLKIPQKKDKLKCPKPKRTSNQKLQVVVAGNTYEAGQCVWHVKNLKPEIPNGWGSAYQWLYNAQASGWSTGSTPKAGAVGVRGNHVVYVLKVKGSQVLISEMNYDWIPYHQREIWKPASTYSYIY